MGRTADRTVAIARKSISRAFSEQLRERLNRRVIVEVSALSEIILSVSEMRLGELREEIQRLGKSPLGEKAYPATSDWIPVTDVLAIVDRFEREWRHQFESALTVAKSGSLQETQLLLHKIITELLS